MTASSRIATLRRRMSSAEFDALIVLIEENRRYLSGFCGQDGQFDETAGALFIAPDQLFLASA